MSIWYFCNQLALVSSFSFWFLLYIIFLHVSLHAIWHGFLHSSHTKYIDYRRFLFLGIAVCLPHIAMAKDKGIKWQKNIHKKIKIAHHVPNTKSGQNSGTVWVSWSYKDIEEFEDTKGVIRIRKLKKDRWSTEKRQKDKTWSTKHNTGNFSLSNTNLTKNRWWTQ
jgi:hypothetical protein